MHQFKYDGLLFEWDEDKYNTNLEKHGVSFKKAAEVFFDSEAIYNEDIFHSYEEKRFIIIGLNKSSNLLAVCYCERKKEENIRIISARRATSKERKLYEEQLWK